MNPARKASMNVRRERSAGPRVRNWTLGIAVVFGLLAAVVVADGVGASSPPDEAAPMPPERAVRRDEPLERPAETALVEFRVAQANVETPEPGPPAKAASTPKPKLNLSFLKKSKPAAKAAPGPAKAAPTSGHPMKIPLTGAPAPDRLKIEQSGGLVSLRARGVPLSELLMVLAQQQRMNIVCAEDLKVPITLTLEQAPFPVVLQSVVAIAGCSWVQEDDVIYVTSVTATAKAPPAIQGRQVRVFQLDFVSANDVEKVVKGMLSPAGQCFASVAKNRDNRQFQETLVVEDIPSYLANVEQYVDRVDQPPRQVMIEAHVLAVTLDSDDRCGVNFSAILQALQHDVKLEARGLAAPTAPQAFFFSFEGSDLDAMLEALRTQNNAKTLASPKVLVLNGQEARIQVGRQLGFRVVTTTETSSMESINFLDVGVVLTVTPRISRDGQVLMHVKPEVSKGEVNTDTGLPEEDTTQVETDVMLPDSRGMVIGGLLQESDVEMQSKVPFFGDLWLVGKLFGRRQVTRERKEIIITLIPRIVPQHVPCESRHEVEVARTHTRLLDRELQPICRPWEGRLPDAIEKPAHLRDLPVLKQRAARRCGKCRACVDAAGPCEASDPYYGMGETVAPIAFPPSPGEP